MGGIQDQLLSVIGYYHGLEALSVYNYWQEVVVYKITSSLVATTYISSCVIIV